MCGFELQAYHTFLCRNITSSMVCMLSGFSHETANFVSRLRGIHSIPRKAYGRRRPSATLSKRVASCNFFTCVEACRAGPGCAVGDISSDAVPFPCARVAIKQGSVVEGCGAVRRSGKLNKTIRNVAGMSIPPHFNPATRVSTSGAAIYRASHRGCMLRNHNLCHGLGYIEKSVTAE